MASYAFLWSVHALLGFTSIFLILPFGALRIKAYILPHWMVQSVGNFVLLATVGIGLFGSNNVYDSHQIAGIALATLMLLQSFTGHSIHSLNVRPKFQRWMRIQHASQGFVSLLVGWWTVISGLQLASFDSKTIIFVGLSTLTEVVGVAVYSGFTRWRKPAQVDVESRRDGMEACEDKLLQTEGWESS